LPSLNRRELLEKCIAFGAVTLAVPASLTSVAAAWDASENKRTATPACVVGPFYKREAPHASALRVPGDAGMPLSLAGGVYSTNGEILPNAKVEIWQTDHFGHYDNEGYRFRTTLAADEKGAYRIESVLPGHYPARVCQHVHYLISAPGHKPLVTQLYFGSDPVFDGDPDKNFSRDPFITSRELVRPITLKEDQKQMVAAVTFDLVVQRL
jgi:protocatechuate 3,4-dioxygenase beta subunit